MSKKSTVMTEGAIWKEILFFSIPLILGNLFQQLYNTVDSIIVGNWIGSEALAAVGSSGAIINLLLGFCIGASAGAGVVVSQFFGAGNREGVRKAVHTTLAIAVAAGAILTVAGVVTTPMILRAMDTPQEVFEQSSQYLQVYFGGIFFSVNFKVKIPADRGTFLYHVVGNKRGFKIFGNLYGRHLHDPRQLKAWQCVIAQSGIGRYLQKPFDIAIGQTQFQFFGNIFFVIHVRLRFIHFNKIYRKKQIKNLNFSLF